MSILIIRNSDPVGFPVEDSRTSQRRRLRSGAVPGRSVIVEARAVHHLSRGAGPALLVHPPVPHETEAVGHLRFIRVPGACIGMVGYYLVSRELPVVDAQLVDAAVEVTPHADVPRIP